MEREKPCYLCVVMSVVVAIGMIIFTVRMAQWLFGLERIVMKKINT